MRWRAAASLALQLLASLALGLGSAWWLLRSSDGFGLAAGPWRVSLLAGSADADLYTRARIALGGLLALARGETMYYVATHDSSGAPLRSRCRYRIRGTPPAARWWSITAYAEDVFLFPDEARRYSVNGATAALDAQGRFTAFSGPGPTAVAGAEPRLDIATPGDRGLMFTLRVYNPAPELAQRPEGLQPPSIEAIGADGAPGACS